MLESTIIFLVMFSELFIPWSLSSQMPIDFLKLYETHVGCLLQASKHPSQSVDKVVRTRSVTKYLSENVTAPQDVIVANPNKTVVSNMLRAVLKNGIEPTFNRPWVTLNMLLNPSSTEVLNPLQFVWGYNSIVGNQSLLIIELHVLHVFKTERVLKIRLVLSVLFCSVQFAESGLRGQKYQVIVRQSS